MTAGDAFLFMITFALFVVLMLAAIIAIMDHGRRKMPHQKEDEDEQPKGD